MRRDNQLQQHLPPPKEAGHSFPINNFGMMDNVERSPSPMNLSNLGPIRLETLQLPKQQEFHLDFFGPLKNIYIESKTVHQIHVNGLIHIWRKKS